MEFVPGQGASVQCPHDSSLGPGFPLSPPVQGKPGLNSMPCPLNAVLLSAANKSLNFHESRTLSDSLEMRVHVVAFSAEGTPFALPNLNGYCPQVVSRILCFNEMLINLDHEFKRITLDGKPQK
jgi:hypothetical protein